MGSADQLSVIDGVAVTGSYAGDKIYKTMQLLTSHSRSEENPTLNISNVMIIFIFNPDFKKVILGKT